MGRVTFKAVLICDACRELTEVLHHADIFGRNKLCRACFDADRRETQKRRSGKG